jgi:hypothetical protein
MIESGQVINKLREERFLKTSDIERLSRSIADHKENDDYYIAHATLLEIEAGSVPKIYKIDCLAIIFKIPLTQMLMVFGIDSRKTEQLTVASPQKETALEPTDLIETDVSFRLNFDNRLNPRETNLLPGKPEEWGIAPTALVKRLQPQRFTYALVGIDDDSMGDIIPPGSLIEIDRNQNVIQESFWRTLRERPIYLVWHDDGYSCGWCQQDRSELLLVTHPVSTRPIRRLKAREATVIGRIVHAWCSLQSPPLSPC